jgi:polyhydroxyalkanoate synthesis repressor PhaR
LSPVALKKKFVLTFAKSPCANKRIGAKSCNASLGAAKKVARKGYQETFMATKTEIVIKKYPNRRLYDTTSSVYITLEDVKRLVEEKKPVKVVDAKTNEDLTRQTLMQILLEEEAGGAPIFTSEMLAQVISFYGHAQHSALGPFLDSSLKAFVQGAEEMAKRAAMMKMGSQKNTEAIVEANAAAWTELAKVQQQAVSGMMEQWSKAAGAWLPKK